jgi:hypothetical protein
MMTRTFLHAFTGVTLAFAIVGMPEVAWAQYEGGDGGCKPTCTTSGCEPDEWQGIGNGIGIFDADCHFGDDCLYPCESKAEEEDELFAGRRPFRDILFDLKRAATQEDLIRIAAAYRDRIVLNVSQRMVLALDGCSREVMYPVSMVLLPAEQVEALLTVGLEDLEDLFPSHP